MNLSIIIPTYKREDILSETVDTILNFYPSQKFEMRIVNDDSEVGLDLAIQDSRVEILQNPAKGAASARNFGVKNSSKDNLLFIDDDIVITEGHLENHLNALEEFPDSLITANRSERDDLVDLLNKTPFGRYKYKHDYIWHEGFKKEKINSQYSYITGAATFSCSMKRSTFEMLEGFDEHFPFAGSEDYDLFERAKKMGSKLIFDKSNICYHNEPYNAEMDVWMSRHHKGVASYILLCEKHPELMKSSRYALYQPINFDDSLEEKIFKLKAYFFSSLFGEWFLKHLIIIGEKVNLNDSIMQRVYNAKFVSSVKKGFLKFKDLTTH